MNALTAIRRATKKRPVSWFNKIIALALLALWVPATQHCDLEAIGLIAVHTDHQDNATCSESHSPCPSENCQVIEDGSYNPSATLAKAPSPSLIACIFSLCLQPAALDALHEPVTPVVARENPLSWVPTRHFVRGAAPQPRAPSVLV